MSEYILERIEMPEIGILRYNVRGIETNAHTKPGLVAICDRLEREPQWSGVLFDHSQSRISYTLPEFTERVEYAAEHFPRRVRLAYVYNPSTLVVCARASKLLNAAGIKAQAFGDADEAMEFLTSSNDWIRRA